jgi:hypothetical protein
MCSKNTFPVPPPRDSGATKASLTTKKKRKEKENPADP